MDRFFGCVSLDDGRGDLGRARHDHHAGEIRVSAVRKQRLQKRSGANIGQNENTKRNRNRKRKEHKKKKTKRTMKEAKKVHTKR